MSKHRTARKRVQASKRPGPRSSEREWNRYLARQARQDLSLNM